MKRLLSTICFVLAAYCARRAMRWSREVLRLNAMHIPGDWVFRHMAWLSRASRREQLWDRRMKRLLVWGGIREEVSRD